MKYTLLFVIQILLIQIAIGQEKRQFCGYDASIHADALREGFTSFDEGADLGLTSIPIAFTFLVKSDGTSPYYNGLEDEIMDSLSHDFIDSGIHFYLCAAPVFIYDDGVFDYEVGNEDISVLYPGIKNNRINVIVSGSLSSSGGAQYCGIASILPNTVFSIYACIPAHTISHEIGHHLNLLHTHETNSGGKELVNGSNCKTAGDHICDTPADPNRLDLVDSDCTWRGTYEDNQGFEIYLTDSNGDIYETDVTNIMSYYGALGCRSHFSYQQSAVMVDKIAQSMLMFGYETPNLQFDIYDQEEICNVGYFVSSRIVNEQAGVEYRWDMDADGNIDHTGVDVHHLYTENGIYTIKLTMVYPDQREYYLSKVCAVNYLNATITAPFVDDFETVMTRDYVTLIESSNYIWRLGLHLAGGKVVAQDQIHYNENSVMEYKIDISTLTDPVLEFDYKCDANELVGGDTLLVELFGCNNPAITLFEKVGIELGTNGAFITESIPLPSITDDIIRIRFTSKGDAQNYHEVSIDNLKLYQKLNTNTNNPEKSKFILYPNPTNALVSIKTTSDISRMDLVDVYGNVIYSYDKNAVLDLSDLAAGIYFVKINAGAEQVVRMVIKSN